MHARAIILTGNNIDTAPLYRGFLYRIFTLVRRDFIKIEDSLSIFMFTLIADRFDSVSSRGRDDYEKH